MEHIKKLSKKDYDEIYALSEFAFQYQLSKEEFERKKQEAAIHEIWGWMEGEKLAAKLHIIPLQCYIGGSSFKMGGINAVATWPEYRRKGMVKQLLRHSLNVMKKNGVTVSFLHPFSFAFYRNFGWELAFVNKKYIIPMEKLREVKWKTAGDVRRTGNDFSLLQPIYHACARQFNGMLVRDEHWWKYRVFHEKLQTAIAYTEKGQADGYVIYQVKNDILTIKEMVSHSAEARQALFQFVANHDSMADKVELTVPENDLLPLLVDNPVFKQELNPYFMARIVDVEAFLKQYPFQQAERFHPFSITVTDCFMEENTGSYNIHCEKDSWKISKQEKMEQDISCSIQLLSMMLLGYRRPRELFELGLISGSSQAVSLLDSVIPVRQTFLSDFF